jgi:hypothetical protein
MTQDLGIRKDRICASHKILVVGLVCSDTLMHFYLDRQRRCLLRSYACGGGGADLISTPPFRWWDYHDD